MSVSRLAEMAGIGVDRMSERARRADDPDLLRLENLDTDLRPPAAVLEATRRAIESDEANSYLPFPGTDELRSAAAELVSKNSGVAYDWRRSVLVSAGGLNGILNVLLAILEPGDEVVLCDPIYIGLINRVRLAGGVPRFVRLAARAGGWNLDLDSLAAAVSRRTRAFLMMSPAMPSGAVLSRDDWKAVCQACCDADAWMVYDSAMERILFDGLTPTHPASFPGMAERTITVGSVSKEYRMIGWRVGWIVSPPALTDDIGLVGISNVVCNVGIAQHAAAVALRAPASDLFAAAAILQERRDLVLEELRSFTVIRPSGGWSLLLDVGELGISSGEAADRLLERGRVAVTPMTGWGESSSDRVLRLVFSNEPLPRLRGLSARFDDALR